MGAKKKRERESGTHTHSTRASRFHMPTVDLGLMSTASIKTLVEQLVCPTCQQSQVECVNWGHIGGGVTFDVVCPDCSFLSSFCSSPKLQSNPRRFDVSAKFCTAWQLAGLTFENLEWVFKLAGGLPPLSKGPYAALLEQVSTATRINSKIKLNMLLMEKKKTTKKLTEWPVYHRAN